MAPPKKPIEERIAALSRPDEPHLIWLGRMKNNRPYLKGVGNPARHLLAVTDPRIQVRNTCGLCNCIEPHHYKVIVETPFKYDDAPPPVWRDPRAPADDQFTQQERAEIEGTLQELHDGTLTREELEEFPPAPHVLEEILRRANVDV